MLFLSSLDNLLKDAYIFFQKDVDNFEIEHKHANFGAFWGRRCSTPLKYYVYQVRIQDIM